MKTDTHHHHIHGSTAAHVLTRLAVLSSKLHHLLTNTRDLHDASFARVDELAPLLAAITSTGENLLIGKYMLRHVLAAAPTPKRRELGNIFVVAPTRGGKGLLAEAQLLTWPHSVIVNDIKGELWKRTAGWRQTFSTVKVIDPRGFGDGYNPLMPMTTEDQFYSVATQLLHKSHEGEGEIFTLRAIDMLTQLFLAARDEGYSPFLYVREALKRGLIATVERLHAVNPDYATGFLDIPLQRANLSDKFLLHSFGTLKAKLKPILTETVIRSLSGSDFTAEDIISGDKPVTVYLKWPEEHLLALAPLIRLIMGSLIKGMISTYDERSGQNCKPVLVLADEAGRTAIPSLADDVTTVVGRKISLWVSIQDLSQLETIYGQSRARTMRNNMDTQIFYRQKDDYTAEFLERKLQKRSGFAKSETSRPGDESAEGKSEQAVPLLRADKITQLEDEDIIAFHHNLPPIRAKRMDWRDYPALVTRANLRPRPVQPLPPLADIPLLTTPEPAQDTPFAPVDPDELSRQPGL
jgi:type IV secretion system protein VirD4